MDPPFDSKADYRTKITSDNTNDYIYGPTGTPVEQISLTTNTLTYLTYTPTNSTWTTTNATGDLTGYWGYDAYGTPSFGTPQSPFGYAGQYLDSVTGLSNMRTRWYSPTNGTLLSRDPDFVVTDTAYIYANDDPINKSDPTGAYPGKITADLCVVAPSFLCNGATRTHNDHDVVVYEHRWKPAFAGLDICVVISVPPLRTGTGCGKCGTSSG
jgi:RHS repeat-associated protein